MGSRCTNLIRTPNHLQIRHDHHNDREAHRYEVQIEDADHVVNYQGHFVERQSDLLAVVVGSCGDITAAAAMEKYTHEGGERVF